MRFAAEVVEHARHFDGNVAGADEGNLLRLLLQSEEAVGGDAVLMARDMRGKGGVATSSEQDFLGIDGGLGAVVEDDFGGVGGEEVSAAVDVFHFVVVEIALVDAVEAGHVGVSFVFECVPVEGGRDLNREPVRFGLMDGFSDGGSIPGDLLGDTTGKCEQ